MFIGSSPNLGAQETFEFVLPVINIVNISLETGQFPHDFKQAIVTPLLKNLSLDVDELKNYRPVSNLKFISKIMEKAVAVRLTDDLSDNKLFEPFQSAYRKDHGVETALVRVSNDILRDVDNKKAVFLVLLDLSSAFDTVDHKLLRNRFKSFGIGGVVLGWIATYLDKRSQVVKIGETLASPVKISFGVPQGPVVKPLFFSIYSSPLAKIAHKHGVSIHLYADDTKLLYLSFDPSDPASEISARHRLNTGYFRRYEVMGAHK